VAVRRRLPTAVEEQGGIRLPGLALRLDLGRGEHPSLLRNAGAMHRLPAFPDDKQRHTLGSLDLPVALTHSGHHRLIDQAYLGAAGQEDGWPLAPVYVRDLAGRVIHTGLNPLPVIPEGPLMPFSCAALETDAPGADLLEQVFLTDFRRLELAHGAGIPLTGRPDTLMQAQYDQPHRYPYKLRVDSFYIDGFRLPQVERLFVEEGDPLAARAMGEEMLARWKTRGDGDYEAFHDEMGGEAWVERMFVGGCTLIPTMEGYNGFFKVTGDFGMADVWPGAAVEGLHEVVEIVADDSPAGTILKVIAPGYATREGIMMAKVVASDGSGYVSPHAADPAPLWPDPALPHTRLAKGAEVWLPTHPSHFEVPALWDWDAEGHFRQVTGPLWDPVHYVYASTQKIIRAFRHAMPENPLLAKVPEEMRPLFHPVVAQTWYDTISTATASQRGSQAVQTPLAQSALDMVPLGKVVAGVGYHPLPTALEYELDPFVMPELSPRHAPEAAPGEVAPVIASSMDVATAQKLLAVTPEPARMALLAPALWEEKGVAYPQLGRYKAESPLPEAPARVGFCYLPDLPTSELMVNVKRFFANRATRNGLASLGAGVPEAMFAFREEALAWRRTRHRLARKYAGWYLWMWWHQANPTETQEKMKDEPERGLIAAEMLLQTQPGAQPNVPKAAPRMGRNSFTAGSKPAKLAGKTKD
jgi:hypothetical protein